MRSGMHDDKPAILMTTMIRTIQIDDAIDIIDTIRPAPP
jgi:hypothetical protein